LALRMWTTRARLGCNALRLGGGRAQKLYFVG
jgi:hypothetical protein